MVNFKKILNLKTILITLSVIVVIASTFFACKYISNKNVPQDTVIPTDSEVVVSPIQPEQPNKEAEKEDDKASEEKPQEKPSEKKPEKEPEKKPEKVPEKEPEISLTISSPKQNRVTVTENSYIIKGNCDPKEKLYLNGKKIKCDKNGDFSYKAQLNFGDNKFVFKYKGEYSVLTITYDYVVIKSITPIKDNLYSGGSKLTVSAIARKGSIVTAKLGNTVITCKETEGTGDFVTFKGAFTLPKGEKTNKNLGQVLFTAKENGVTDTMKSGNVTVKKESIIKDSDPVSTPKGGSYIDVGSGLIATVVQNYAETFNGKTTDDYSNPSNSYLPKGTQDYCSTNIVKNNGNTYYKLRCGKRIYTVSNPDKSYARTVATTSVGKLPNSNKLSVLSFKTEKQYSFLTLKTEWKAPFEFELLNQSYRKTKCGYTTDKTTFSYIDITFNYASKFEGEIKLPKNHPIFESAKIIKNKSDYTLRLKLKKVGAFYGWDAYYDSEGNLVFRFLNPAKMESENSLKGISVYVDVGHGGSDPGAPAPYSPKRDESACNLTLALSLKKELEKLGATVLINRTNNSTGYTPPERMQHLRNANADYCIAIHHDSNRSSSYKGFMTAYFTPFSKSAANYIFKQTKKTGLYKKYWDVEAHYYYVSRVTSCPAVLTENGFMSNKADYKNITNTAAVNKKAKALALGVLDYFRSIQ